MSVGILLRQARESAGMSLEELSEATCVRKTVLRDLEDDNFESSGGLAYARGHIRNIAKVLHANGELLVEEFNSMNQDFNRPMIELLSENNVTPSVRSESRISFGALGKVAAIIVALVIAIPTAASFVHSAKKPPANRPPTAGSTWLAVTDSSGAQIFSGMLANGSSQSFDDSQLINLTIGNAGAVNLNVNGKDAGAPGTRGEVVHLQFGPGASSQG